ncbi:MAG: GDSL-type esterase/lipase family protein [Bryobacteraceae bacterium]
MDTFFGTLLLALLATLALHSEPLRIVCFGDSTTATRPGVFTYCEALQKEFGGDRAEIVNRGVPANTTADAKARFEHDVMDEKPGLVFLMFGLNDSAIDVWKNPPADRPRVSLGDFRANLRYFLDALQATGARAVLMTFNPTRWTPKLKDLYAKPPYLPEVAEGLDVGRSEYIAAIRQVAAEKHVELLDVNSGFKAYAEAPGHALNDLLLDGIHPNSLGQSITAALARRVVEAALTARGNR